MEWKKGELKRTVDSKVFFAIFTKSYHIKPYQTCLNVLVRFCRKKDELKRTISSEVSIFGHFDILGHTTPFSMFLLDPANSVEKKMN